jgi:hypothetical protein
MVAARVNWHGQDLPVVSEIVEIGGVSTPIEIPELGEPELRQIVALLATLDRFERAARLAPDLLLERVAGLYIKRGGTVETWRAYETMLGVPRSKTRQPTSMFQPFLRWANGGEPDFTGKLAKLAAPLDEWVEFGEKRPSPITSAPGTSEFAEWLGQSKGYTNVAEGRRGRHDENYSESISANIAPSADASAARATLLYSICDDASGASPKVSSKTNRENATCRPDETTQNDKSDDECREDAAYLTPPEFLAELDREFNFTKGFDPCPYPRPDGFDGVTVEWPQSTYCNPPFRKKDAVDKRGIAAFARKAIEENKLGKTVVLVLPTKSTINFLLEEGAELRSARRINWVDPKTGQPATTSPSSNMLAILRGKDQPAIRETAKLKARLAELEAENATLKARIEELISSPGRALDTN